MDPDDASLWDAAQEGAELLADHQLEDAVEALTEVLTEQPHNHYAAYFLGQAQFGLQRWERALKAYVRALELAPDYLGAMVGAGHTLRMMRRLPQALRMGNEVLARKKEDPDALYLMGLAHYQQGDRARARDYLERFLTTRPEVEVAIEVRGLLQVLGGQVEPLPADRAPSDDE